MIYIIIFSILCVLAFFIGDIKPGKTILAFLFLFFTIFIGFRGDDVDNDYTMYVAIITKDLYIAEYSFKIISNFFYKYFNSTVATFVFYAALGVGMKLVIIKRYSNYFWASMVIYFSTFFILQEMNAIRSGVAAGFMLFGLEPWSVGNKKKTIVYVFFASLFHYSMLVLFPLIAFVKNNDKKLKSYILLIPLAYILYYLVSTTSLLSIFEFSEYTLRKSSAYATDDDEIIETNVFSTVFIIKMIYVILMYTFRKKLSLHNPRFYLYFKLYCIGLFMVILLAKMPAASMRFLDVFIIVELFILPTFIKLFDYRFRWMPKLIIILYSAFYLYLYMEKAEYIRPYFFIFNN